MDLVFLNGALVPSAEARISLFDRGFLYGDGLFETVRVQSGKAFRWAAHMERLEGGLRALDIRLPLDRAALTRLATELIGANRCVDAILRVTISRGVGRRGYSPCGAGDPTIALSLHPRPPDHCAPGDAWRLVTSTVRLLAGHPAAAVKTASKLSHVLARAEADRAGADDALLLNHRDEVVETTSSNLFWIRGERLLTPAAAAGGLPGVAHRVMFELAPACGLSTEEVLAGLDELREAEAIFVTNVVTGPVGVTGLDGREVAGAERVRPLRELFERRVQDETS